MQFFDASVVAAALALADAGARVVAAGLDQDFRRLPFGPIPDLLAHAEFVDKLQAVCHRCGGPATTTQRLVDGRPAPYTGETVVVGAAEQYEARCRDCHEPGADAHAVAAYAWEPGGPTAARVPCVDDARQLSTAQNDRGCLFSRSLPKAPCLASEALSTPSPARRLRGQTHGLTPNAVCSHESVALTRGRSP